MELSSETMGSLVSKYMAASLPPVIYRRGMGILNPAHFAAVDNRLPTAYFTALELMPEIYAHTPVSEQSAITRRLLDGYDDDDMALYMWWHAIFTGHELVARAVTDSKRLNIQESLDWDTPVDTFKQNLMKPVLTAADNAEETERLTEFLREHSLHAEELLFEAAVKGKDGVVCKLLEANISPVSEEHSYLAPLHAACFQGHLECAKVLVEVGGLSVDDRDPKNGGTPLQRAAAGGHIDIVKWLLEQGADITLQTDPMPEHEMNGQEDALIFAAFRAHTNIVKCLLDANATIDRRAAAAAAEGGSEEIFDLLVGRAGYPLESDLAGSDWKGGKLTAEQRQDLVSALNYSGSQAPPSLIRKILAYFAPLDESNQLQRTKVGAEVEASAFNALRSAVRRDSAASAKALIDFLQDSVDPAEPEGSDEAPTWSVRVPRALSDLVSLCGEAPAPQTLALLTREYGLGVDALHSQHKTTALYHAARDGHADMLRTLVTEFGADVHVGNGRYANGPTALWKAVDGGHELAARALLELGGPIERVNGTLTADTKTVYVLAIADYRAPVVLVAEHDPRWDEAKEPSDPSRVEYLCLEYPDGLWWFNDVTPRKADAELKDERALRAPPEDPNDGGELAARREL